jgi:ribosomal protein L9
MPISPGYSNSEASAQDVPEMGLQKFQVTLVSPGAARNHLVPTGAAVNAHYLNREIYKDEIANAEAADKAEPEDQQAFRAKVQQARLLKRLKTLKLVRCRSCSANVADARQ